MIVRISIEAQRDLEAIADFIARENPSRAISFVGELRAKCHALAELHHAYPLVERYEAHAVRRCRHGSYLIFYKVEPTRVVVLHVLHGARDYEAILF